MFYQYMQQIHRDCWHYPAGRRDMFPAAGGRVPLRLLNRLHVSQRVTRHLLDLCEFREKCCVKSGGLWWKHVSIFGGPKSSALWCILMVVPGCYVNFHPFGSGKSAQWDALKVAKPPISRAWKLLAAWASAMAWDDVRRPASETKAPKCTEQDFLSSASSASSANRPWSSWSRWRFLPCVLSAYLVAVGNSEKWWNSICCAIFDCWGVPMLRMVAFQAGM